MPRNEIVTFDAVDIEDSLGLRGLPILVDPDDYEGIHIASSNLALDLEKVTGHKSAVWTGTDNISTPVSGVILVGSIEKCRYFSEFSTDVLDQLQGEWEHFTTSLCPSPWGWAEKVFVVCGSDKRGAIYGAYTLSEQIGVSPYVPPSSQCQLKSTTDIKIGGIGGRTSRFSIESRYMRCQSLSSMEDLVSNTEGYSSTMKLQR